VATVRHPVVKIESSASILVCSGLELRFETYRLGFQSVLKCGLPVLCENILSSFSVLLHPGR